LSKYLKKFKLKNLLYLSKETKEVGINGYIYDKRHKNPNKKAPPK